MRLKTCCQKDAPHRIVGDADSGDDTDVIALVQCEPGELCGKSLLTRSRLHEDVAEFEQEIALIERHAGFFYQFSGYIRDSQRAIAMDDVRFPV